nr:peptide-methionine (S)-S-oxide reductase MsrA [Pseudohongiella nitratireducens]
MSTGQVIAQPDNSDQAVATFAGGCFWCMEPPFDELEGVSSTISGYIGGHVENPSYEQVTTGRTGHAEAMQVTYDPEVVDYATLLDVYWQNIDPLDSGGQFCDRGSSYRSTIFVHTAEQRELAEASKQEIVASGQLNGEIVTPIEEATTFYPAEEYHQDYYEKNPLRYRFYKWNCGREQRLEEVWGEN